MNTYAVAQDAVRLRRKIDRSAATLLDDWAGFIAEVTEGYEWDFSEYRHDIVVRDQLEQLLASPDLAGYAEHLDLRNNVESLDARFRALGHPDYTFANETVWWRRLVPQRAGEAMGNYLVAVHGWSLEETAVGP